MGLSKVDHLIARGIPPEHAVEIGTERVATGITATGSAITDAYLLRADYNVVETVAASTGVQLDNYPIGSTVYVDNAGANTLSVYPHSSTGTIDTGTTAGSAGAAQTIATAKTGRFTRVSVTDWRYVLLN